ncbi:MAG: hypothetical protein M1838_000473 [Thelocarpon superellum]|nr:MAG: hypothetical protein M1838_000473 [Thelocarpon superellum]
MPLRDLLKKKEKEAEESHRIVSPYPPQIRPSDITFLRTDSTTQELISPPSFPQDEWPRRESPTEHKRRSRFRTISDASSHVSAGSTRSSNKSEKRLSDRLHLRRGSAASSVHSVHVPQDLPDIVDLDGAAELDDRQAQWEQRATLLAKVNAESFSGASNSGEGSLGVARLSLDSRSQDLRRSRSASISISDPAGDENIHEAIRLHEQGDLARSTAMFGRLADPHGANNALSQVLYGLALRHGWGIAANPTLAVKFLSTAAAHTAEIEQLALNAGMKKGGAAKGELVLAIFELANCFRNGWGVPKDAVAAKQYYETAANLGDTDACNEVAWCYLEGFGTPKDKFASAKYYRQAEKMGSKTMGNSWYVQKISIWKDKYNPK